MHIVAVTEPEYEKGRCHFSAVSDIRCVSAPAEEEGLCATILRYGARHVIVGVEKYTDSLYRALPRGGVIARFGVGYDGIDVVRAQRAGLICTNTPGVLDQSVAELTVNLILMAARQIVPQAVACSSGHWRPILGRDSRGRVLTIVGCGAIGCRVAEIASAGLRMQVVGCDVRDLDVERLRQQHGFASVTKDFRQAVAEADFVSLHIPYHNGTSHFMNAKHLSLLPGNAWLINTSRGGVVDEKALYEALTSGRPAGAALDVFETEPYEPVDPACDLRRLANVIMLPHIASTTEEACARMAKRCLQNIRLAERDEHMKMDIIEDTYENTKREQRQTSRQGA
jgi:lactate dehydrogenase-like 2-hydroxyacid dehydrogenase